LDEKYQSNQTNSKVSMFSKQTNQTKSFELQSDENFYETRRESLLYGG